jgi:hypothetical protein
MYPWHRPFHKDSKKSSFNFLRFFYGFLWIFKHQHKIWDIKPKKGTSNFQPGPWNKRAYTSAHMAFQHCSQESQTLHLPPAVMEFADWSVVFFLGTYREGDRPFLVGARRCRPSAAGPAEPSLVEGAHSQGVGSAGGSPRWPGHASPRWQPTAAMARASPLMAALGKGFERIDVARGRWWQTQFKQSATEDRDLEVAGSFSRPSMALVCCSRGMRDRGESREARGGGGGARRAFKSEARAGVGRGLAVHGGGHCHTPGCLLVTLSLQQPLNTHWMSVFGIFCLDSDPNHCRRYVPWSILYKSCIEIEAIQTLFREL